MMLSNEKSIQERRDGTVLSKFSLFHEPWWLSSASGGDYSEVVLEQGSKVVGRLPFSMVRSRAGFRIICMPNFTHVLGPAVDSGNAKFQTRLTKRNSIIRSLIDQLPHYDFFKQVLDPSFDDGLALSDGLVFQEKGFQITPQYTFQIDCREDVNKLWDGMHLKVRQHIRRAEQNYHVSAESDPLRFIDFYKNNLQRKKRTSFIDFAQFPHLFSECTARGCGVLLAANLPTGSPVAMTFLVWSHGIMYYLLSTRAVDMQDNGSANLLVWTGMKKAHQLGLLFDLDGVTTRGTARFLSGFGGEPKTRLVITRGRPAYRAVQALRKVFYGANDRDTDAASKLT